MLETETSERSVFLIVRIENVGKCIKVPAPPVIKMAMRMGKKGRQIESQSCYLHGVVSLASFQTNISKLKVQR